MSTRNYWSGVSSQRLNRRRLLAGAVGAAGAAIVAACGGDDAAGPVKDKSGLLSEAVDTSKQARRGGVLKTLHHQDVQIFDPMVTSLPNQVPVQSIYTRFTRVKPGLVAPSAGDLEGDQAESWEFSPDKLQITFKLRPDSHLDPRPPTNGRLMDAQDVVFSWQRLAAVATVRSQYVNAISPDAPILSLSAPDPRTIVMKLKEPQASVPALLADSVAGTFWLLPREADGGFNPRNAAFGASAFYLDEWVPSSRMVFKRNPGYWDKQRPYVDTIELPIITEYAQVLSQFASGSIHVLTGSTQLRKEDLVPTKQRVPSLRMLQTDVESHSGRCFYGFRSTSTGAKAPFKDERVRQAWSMSWDRDLFIDAVYNVSKFTAEGLPMSTRWNSAGFRGNFYEGWWLDPQSKEFGPNAKYFQHNVAEVKKLLSAAGYPDGLDTEAYYATTGEQGRDFASHIEILLGMAAEAGLRIKTVAVPFQQEWVPRIRDSKGEFDGISFRPNAGPPEPSEFLYASYHPGGGQFLGFDSKGAGTHDGDPSLSDLLLKMRREFDVQKRIALAHEVQRYDAAKQYLTYFPGGANSFELFWPVVGNALAFRGGQIPNLDTWIDDSKPPLKG